MRAVVLPDYGPASVLQLQTLPDPAPGPNEIAVRVAGASVNPIDWKQRSGVVRQYFPLKLPAVLGRDAAGTVAAVGPGVTAFAVGDRVMGRVPGAAHAEIAVGPAAGWARVPAGLDLADAGALPLVLLTGAQLVEEAVDAQPGETILVTGATGSVGRVAVWAAKARGAKVWAGVRGKYRDEAAKLGADGVVALEDDAEVAGLPALDGVANTVIGDAVQKVLGKLKAGGKVGSVVGEPTDAKQRGFAVKAIVTHDDSKRLSELAQAVADGRLAVPIAKRFPLEQAAAAHELAEIGATGKVLLVP
ncbi:MAG TPA: NADP-dependent oxidoreductase [Polyangia bacterium]|jgi:NADPH:quinone reductase-like Zn-dependent oxidoreductase